MGSSSYSHDVFSSTMRAHAAAGTSAFTHTASIHSGTAAAKTHDSLMPNLVAGPKSPFAGKVMRESCDSDLHPVSTAVGICFDVTGSMSRVPELFVKKLGNLMSVLVKKGYLEGPQVLFGAIGDAYTDSGPLQIGQFEAGNEMDAALGLIYLEGGGGVQTTESYELAMYFMARHTALDCFTKRGKKGYLFLSGDELPYGSVNKDQVKRLIGDDLEADIPLATILDELREKYEVFWLFPKGTSHWDNPRVNATLSDLFGQNLIKLTNPDDVCEVIAAAIGALEGFDVKSIEADLIDTGSTKISASTAIAAISSLTSSGLIRKVATVDGTLAAGGVDTLERL